MCAFENCINLTTITLSDNITNIGYGAFKNCPKLSQIIVNAPDEAAFNRVKALLPEELRDKVVYSEAAPSLISSTPQAIFYTPESTPYNPETLSYT